MVKAVGDSKKLGYTSSMTPPNLIRSAELGDLDSVKLAIELGENVNLQDHRTGITALHAACARGHYYVVEYLLSCRDVDPTISDSGGRLAGTLALDVARDDIFELIQHFMLGRFPAPEANGP